MNKLEEWKMKECNGKCPCCKKLHKYQAFKPFKIKINREKAAKLCELFSEEQQSSST